MKFKNHTVASYDNDLKSLDNSIKSTLKLVEKSIDMVKDVLNCDNVNNNEIKKIKSHDEKINDLDHEIEQKIVQILAIRQPMAVDLRYIVSSLKISSNLEKAGDKAKSAIKAIVKFNNEIPKEYKKDLLEMLDFTKYMIKRSVNSFLTQNIDDIDEIIEQDDKIDAIYKKLFLILDSEGELSIKSRSLMNIILISKSIERIADYATNIAEISSYVVTGKIYE